MKPGAIHSIEALVPLPGDQDAPELVLILHDDDAFLHESAMVLVVPLELPPETIHGHAMVKIVPTLQNGLTALLVGAIDRLHAVDRERIGDRLGEIDRSALIDVYRVLDRLIGRNPGPPPSSRSGDTVNLKL